MRLKFFTYFFYFISFLLLLKMSNRHSHIFSLLSIVTRQVKVFYFTYEMSSFPLNVKIHEKYIFPTLFILNETVPFIDTKRDYAKNSFTLKSQKI